MGYFIGRKYDVEQYGGFLCWGRFPWLSCIPRRKTRKSLQSLQKWRKNDRYVNMQFRKHVFI